MIRRLFRRLRKNDKGATVVEFAIVSLLLFTLIFGIIEFGWIFFGWITLTGAVREGARLAIVGEGIADVKKVVKAHASIFQLKDEDISISPRGYHGTLTSVSAKGDLPLAIGLFLNDSTISLSAEATMRQE